MVFLRVFSAPRGEGSRVPLPGSSRGSSRGGAGEKPPGGRVPRGELLGKRREGPGEPGSPGVERSMVVARVLLTFLIVFKGFCKDCLRVLEGFFNVFDWYLNCFVMVLGVCLRFVKGFV